MSKMFIANGQNDESLGHIRYRNVLSNSHKKSLEDGSETFDFVTHADKPYSQYIEGNNRIIIPGEDGDFLEFTIYEVQESRIDRQLEVYTIASYAGLTTAKVIDPHTTDALSAAAHAQLALAGTEVQVGTVDFKGTRTLKFDKHTYPYAYLRKIASEFDLELNFRIEHDNGKIIARYADLIDKIGQWRGRRVEFGKDLMGLRRIENTENIVTALKVIGPVQEDGTRLEVLVEDQDALKRWGREDPDTGQLHPIIKEYEPQMALEANVNESRLKELGEAELAKRVNAIVSYEGTIADLEKVPGLENKKIRFGDTIQIKDTSYEPALYLEARVYFQDRDIKDRAQKQVRLGDFIEYTEEEVNAIWKSLQDQIKKIANSTEPRKVIATQPPENKEAIWVDTSNPDNVIWKIWSESEQKWKAGPSGPQGPRGLQGIQGPEGEQGIPGEPGEDGQSSYTHIAYADDEQGSGFSQQPEGKAYIGMYTDHTSADSTNPSDYKWSLIKGADGAQGVPGPKGDDGRTPYFHTAWANNATGTSGFSTTDSTDKLYIGTYTDFNAADSTDPSQYNWTKIKGEKGDKGDQGPQGVQGPAGEDGEPTYIWIRYADDDQGNGMSQYPDGKRYLGLAPNKSTPNESDNPNDYVWSPLYDNVQIDVKNLLIGTKDKVDGFANKVTHNGLTYGLFGYGWSFSFTVDLKAGETYTVSVPVFNPSETDTSQARIVRGQELGNYLELVQPRKATTITNTFTPTQDEEGATIRFLVNGSQYPALGWYYPMLQKGNIDTGWTPALEDVQTEIDSAKETASTAKTTADGKNTVIYSASQPSTAGRKVNDVWFDTNDGYKMYRFDGSKWVAAQFGENAIVAHSITANHIKSLLGLNVNDQFIVDANGNVKFAGNLEGASGTFGQVSVKNGDFLLEDDVSNDKTTVRENSNMISDHSFEYVMPDAVVTPIGNLANVYSVRTDWLGGQAYNWWNNTKPEHARVMVSMNMGTNTLHGQRSTVLRPLDYGIWEQIVDIPRQLSNTQALSLSAYVAPYEETTFSVTVSMRLQLLNSNGVWLEDLANESFVLDHTNKYDWQRISVTYKGNISNPDYKIRIRLFLLGSSQTAFCLCDGVQLVPFEYPAFYYPETALYRFTNGYDTATELTTEMLSVGNYASIVNMYAGRIEPLYHNFVSLFNGWSNYGNSTQPARATKTSDWMVYLSGVIQDGLVGNYTAFVLPEGLRPINIEFFKTSTANGGSADIWIYPNGDVRVRYADSNSWVSLSGISFFAG